MSPLIEDRGWTRPQQHMVAYHTTHLIGLATAALSVLVLALGALAVADALGMPEHPLQRNVWTAIFVATPLLTAAAWLLKIALLKQATPDAELFDLTLVYKRAMIAAHLGFAISGGVPVLAGFTAGLFSYHLLITLVPVAAMIMNFPHERKVAVFFDEVAGVITEPEEPDEGE